jgi:hypothetical protein
MQKLNAGYQFDLHRLQIIALTAILIIAGFSSQAQTKRKYVEKNLPGYDEKKIHYGFSLGFQTTYNSLLLSEQFDQLPQFTGVNAKPSPGFNLGFLAQIKMNDFYDFRLHPTISFYENRIDFVRAQGADVFVQEEIIEGTRFEVPLLIKFKSSRVDNHRMYLIGGLKAIVEGGRRREDTGLDDRINVLRSDLAVDIGLGSELYFSFFKFSPELRYSFGLGNILGPGDSDTTKALQRLSFNSVSLILNFQ